MTIVEISILIGIVIIILLQLNKAKNDKGNTATEFLQKDIREFKELVDKKFDRNNENISKALTGQFDSYRKQTEDITKEITEMKNTSKEILSFTDQLGQLEKILTNPKQRGALGEYFLETVLKNILPPNNYKLQYKFNSGEIVDAVLFLDKNKIVPIDSKFSLENYNKILDETLSKVEIANAERQLVSDLKLRITETSKYIKPNEGTLDFAFMFIPSETLYYDLLTRKIGQENILEYAFKEKKVIIVSPTTFYAYLQTVLQGLKSLEIEQKAQEIVHRLNDLNKHMDKYIGAFEKVGKGINATANNYNDAQRQFSLINKDIKKVTSNEDFKYDYTELRLNDPDEK